VERGSGRFSAAPAPKSIVSFIYVWTSKRPEGRAPGQRHTPRHSCLQVLAGRLQSSFQSPVLWNTGQECPVNPQAGMPALPAILKPSGARFRPLQRWPAPNSIVSFICVWASKRPEGRAPGAASRCATQDLGPWKSLPKSRRAGMMHRQVFNLYP